MGRFSTEVIIGHLEITTIAKKEEIATGHVKRQGNKYFLQLFFYSSGTIHMKFIPEGVNVNKSHYCKEILRCLHNLIPCKRPELWRRKNWLLLHHNAPTHFCACPSGAGKTTGNNLPQPSRLA
jgi:hypothetical protein